MVETEGVEHKFIDIAGIRTFYREAGPADAPVVLLPHGYPCSSFQYRNLMPALADKWRTLAPDFPGFGYSDTPEDFAYDFDGYAEFLNQFIGALGVDRFVVYLHDYGSQIGLRLAIRRPQQIRGLIIQNGDIYEDTLGPKYEYLKTYWADPTPEKRAKLIEAVSEDGFRHEFVGEVDERLRNRLPPDLWKLHWSLMTEKRREIMVALMEQLKANLGWFRSYQAYLREHQPPVLIAWGPQDGYMPEASARAYLRDLPNAALHFVDGGHWALETSLGEMVPLIREFLQTLD